MHFHDVMLPVEWRRVMETVADTHLQKHEKRMKKKTLNKINCVNGKIERNYEE